MADPASDLQNELANEIQRRTGQCIVIESSVSIASSETDEEFAATMPIEFQLPESSATI